MAYTSVTHFKVLPPLLTRNWRCRNNAPRDGQQRKLRITGGRWRDGPDRNRTRKLRTASAAAKSASLKRPV